MKRVRLSSYVKPYWMYAVAAPLLMIIEVVCDLLQPSLMARIIDEGVANGDLPVIFRVGGYMLAAALLGIIGGAGCTVFSTLTSQHLVRICATICTERYRRFRSTTWTNFPRHRSSRG
jgi:ATP-binding cassette subfamily B protein